MSARTPTSPSASSITTRHQFRRHLVCHDTANSMRWIVRGRTVTQVLTTTNVPASSPSALRGKCEPDHHGAVATSYPFLATTNLTATNWTTLLTTTPAACLSHYGYEPADATLLSRADSVMKQINYGGYGQNAPQLRSEGANAHLRISVRIDECVRCTNLNRRRSTVKPIVKSLQTDYEVTVFRGRVHRLE